MRFFHVAVLLLVVLMVYSLVVRCRVLIAGNDPFAGDYELEHFARHGPDSEHHHLSTSDHRNFNAHGNDHLMDEERVLLYNVIAFQKERDGKLQWEIDLHAFLYHTQKLQRHSWRVAFVKKVMQSFSALRLSHQEETRMVEKLRIFVTRVGEVNRNLTFAVNNIHFQANTGQDGQVRKRVVLKMDQTMQQFEPLTSYSVTTPSQGTVSALVQFIPRDKPGISVISDIDDTIKITNVTNVREMLRNTFLRDYRAVPYMSELYQMWKQNFDPYFHYVSSSPEQLYEQLYEFVQDNRFPIGSFHLKHFSANNLAFFNLFRSSKHTKPPIIRSLMKNCPNRKFILVGDDGESDPEIYAHVYEHHREQVQHIFIHCVKSAQCGSAEERFQQTFRNVPGTKWTVFNDARQLFPLFSRFSD